MMIVNFRLNKAFSLKIELNFSLENTSLYVYLLYRTEGYFREV